MKSIACSFILIILMFPFEVFSLSPETSFNKARIDAEKMVYQQMLNLWGQGKDYRDNLISFAEENDFIPYQRDYNATEKIPEKLKSIGIAAWERIEEGVMRNIRQHGSISDAVILFKETEKGWEGLAFDYGLGARKLSTPVEDLSQIFDRRLSYGSHNGGGSGVGLFDLANFTRTQSIRIGSMNKGLLRVVDRLNKKQYVDSYHVRQVNYNLTDLHINDKATGFFYHFLISNFPIKERALTPIEQKNILGVELFNPNSLAANLLHASS